MAICRKTKSQERDAIWDNIHVSDQLAARHNYYESSLGSPLIRIVFNKLIEKADNKDKLRLDDDRHLVIDLLRRLVAHLKSARCGARIVVEADIDETIARLDASIKALIDPELGATPS